MVCTPKGVQVSSVTTRRVLSASIGAHCASAVSTLTLRLGSETRYSRFSARVNSSTAARTAAASAVTMTVSEAAQMALSLAPPAAETRRVSAAPQAARSRRPCSLLALARPVPISMPEWPPTRPETLMARVSPAKCARWTGRALVT